MNQNTMPGDAEAAAAVAGMIETIGLPKEAAIERWQRCWCAYVSRTWEDDGFPAGPVAYEIWWLSEHPVGIRRSVATGYTDTVTRKDHSYPTEAKALAATIEQLLDRREKLTQQIEGFRGRLNTIIAAEAVAEIEVVK